MRYFASDHHMGHANILKFTTSDGKALRTFDSVDDMNEFIIKQHNSIVKPNDSVYFLGDFVINRRYLYLASRFNGKKTLIMGNHDIFDYDDYIKAGFKNLAAFRKFDKFACTHIPVHEDSLGRWGVNVHGHTHSNKVMKMHNGIRTRAADPRYISVCMEQLDNYRPISEDELNDKIKNSI